MSCQLIEEINSSLERNPLKTAIEEKAVSYSYRELKEHIYFLSHILNTNRFQTVAVIGEPSFITASSILSVLLSEAAYVPIEPSWPVKRINKILQHSGADAVLSHEAVLKKHSLDFKKMAVPCFLNVCLIEESHRSLPDTARSLLNGADSDFKAEQEYAKKQKSFCVKKYLCSTFKKTYFPPARAMAFAFPKKAHSSIAYIMYTSGSTGEPKGVKVSLMALQKFLSWIKAEFQISSEDRFSYTASLGFGASIRQIFSPVLSDSQMICFSPETVKSPVAFLNELKEKQITLLNAPPIVLQQLAEQAKRQKADKSFLSNVRLVLAGGDLFPKEILDLWYDQFQHPHTVVNLYGSTESIVNASSYKTSLKKRGLSSYETLPIGKPRPGLAFLLLNEKGDIIEKEEIAGDLYIQSSFLSSGYHNNTKETHKLFSFLEKENEMLYNTGDRALKLPSENYLVLGRKDSQVQMYGQRLELGEIENTLNSHPQVKRSFVVHFKAGRFDKIVAYVQMKDKQKDNERVLRDFLSEELPSYMMPYEFQPIDSVPVTRSNKVDYKKLKELAKERFYNSRRPNEEKGAKISNFKSFSDPELAHEIKKVWKKYLGEKKILNDQSFFDIGGDSVLAVSVYQALCEKFSVLMDPYVFYTSPTINNMIQTLRQSQNKSFQTKKQQWDKKPKPRFKDFWNLVFQLQNIKKLFFYCFLKVLKLYNKMLSALYKKNSIKRGAQSPQQKSFIFMKQIFNEIYNGCFSVPIQNSFDKEEFTQALQLVIQSQESLRTVFVGEEQMVLSDYPSEVLFYDLKTQSKERQESAIKEAEERILRHNFDLSSLPLFKLALLCLSEEKSHLILCINHIVGDGWSLQAFLSELNTSYSFLKREGPAPSLHSYLNYTKSYRAFCRQNFKNNQAFWNNQLADLSSYNVSLQFEKKDPLASEDSFKLDKSLAEKASAYSQKQHTQDFYLYLALWAESLKEFLACSKICFWTTYHGRDFPFKGISTMIGSIARTAPLFIPLDSQKKKPVLKTVQEAYLKALAHKDFNILKPFLSNEHKNISNNWIGFNYLDFKPFSRLTKALPFSMDLNKGTVRLSSSKKSYQRLYLFFSIHNYKDHLDLRVYGKAIKEHKKWILNSMKEKLEQLSI